MCCETFTLLLVLVLVLVILVLVSCPVVTWCSTEICSIAGLYYKVSTVLMLKYSIVTNQSFQVFSA